MRLKAKLSQYTASHCYLIFVFLWKGLIKGQAILLNTQSSEKVEKLTKGHEQFKSKTCCAWKQGLSLLSGDGMAILEGRNG